MKLVLALLVVFCPAVVVHADAPPRPLGSFDAAKKVARDAIYANERTDFYCGCDFKPTRSRSGGAIEPGACGYKPRKNKARGRVLEWEHVMPAYYFGHTRMCWTKGHKQCQTTAGQPFKGRECCARVDNVFRRIEADLHNLTPAVGELNGDRSNLPYGLVAGEPRQYGRCDFEIGGKPRAVEPRDIVRGDAARIWFYMIDTYRVRVSAAQLQLLRNWAAVDPVDEWERLRNKRIAAAQGNLNPYVQ